MAEVGVAACAKHFNAAHAVGVVVAVGDAILSYGFKETGPSAVAGEFGVGFKQNITAYGAIVRSPDVDIPVLAGECAFRALLTRDVVEVGWQDLLPFFIGYIQVRCIGVGVVRVVFPGSVGLELLAESSESEEG